MAQNKQKNRNNPSTIEDLNRLKSMKSINDLPLETQSESDYIEQSAQGPTKDTENLDNATQENGGNQENLENVNVSFFETSQSQSIDWQDKAMRLGAEMQNISRQHELDLAGTAKHTKKKTVLSIVKFLNTMHLAFSFAPKTEDPEITKFIGTLKYNFDALVTDLKEISVELIIPKIGDPFDPKTMSSLNESTAADPVVQNIVSLGTLIDGTITSPSMVMLG